jgi:hypothetical protein
MEKEKQEWEIREEEQAQEICKHLSQYVNSMGRRPKYFAECVSQEHRTLQQSMFNVFMSCIAMWAEKNDKGMFDGRNEFTVKTSKKIMEFLDGNINAPFI